MRENMAGNNNNKNRYMWSDKEAKVYLDLIHEKNIIILDGKQERNASMFSFRSATATSV